MLQAIHLKKGADGRLVGVLLADVALLVAFGAAFYVGLTTTNLLSTFQSFVGK
jgi:hypothetical protein